MSVHLDDLLEPVEAATSEADFHARWLASAAREYDARLSPDGAWLAYRSNETGAEQVHVRTYETATGTVGPSTVLHYESDLDEMFWSHEGDKLYLLDDQSNLSVVNERAAGADMNRLQFIGGEIVRIQVVLIQQCTLTFPPLLVPAHILNQTSLS